MTDDELIDYFEGNSFWRAGTEPWPRLIALARIGAAVQPQDIPSEGPIKKIMGPKDCYYQLDGGMLICFARSNMEPVAFYDISALPVRAMNESIKEVK